MTETKTGRVKGVGCRYPDTLAGGLSKAADIADLLACSTDDLHRREMQLWVAREIRAFRDFKQPVQ